MTNPVAASTAPKRRPTPRVWLLSGLSLLLLLGGLVGTLVAKAEHIVLGAEAYVYGFPLVIMDITRANAALSIGPENQLRRVRQFPGAAFRDVVRPNVDTLYTTAFIDMDQGPWVFELPANRPRYELMAFMDAWTDVFAAPGTRTTGSAGGRFLLVGPHWHGETPSGLTRLRAPTRMVWLIGRTQTKGRADYPLVHQMQDELRLRKLPDWLAGRDPTPTAWQAASPHPAAPMAQLHRMDTGEYFTRLARLMADNPPRAADAPMRIKLQRIGVQPGAAPQWSRLERWSVGLGRRIADWKVAQELGRARSQGGAWSTPPALLGNYGTHYNIRAVVSMIGIGANLPIDAMYPHTQVDAEGQALHGDHCYRLHFKAGELPPVSAFWSVTAYGQDDYLIDNPLRRHARASHDDLLYNADGSLDLWVQSQAPPGERQRNWLPVKAGAGFLLNARLYGPHTDALEGRWHMPALLRTDSVNPRRRPCGAHLAAQGPAAESGSGQ